MSRTNTGYHGQLAEDASDVALPRAHLFIGRHHEADARRGTVNAHALAICTPAETLAHFIAERLSETVDVAVAVL